MVERTDCRMGVLGFYCGIYWFKLGEGTAPLTEEGLDAKNQELLALVH